MSLVFPVECRVCGREVESTDCGVACETCWANTTIFTGSEMLCIKCGAFFASRPSTTAVSRHQCDEQHYERAYAVGVYEKALAASIVRLKTAPVIPHRLSEELGACVKRLNEINIDLVVPVPLSKQRFWERGFNQAEIIAKVVSRFCSIEIDAVSLARTTHTQMHRAGMDRRRRELTVVNAFELRRRRLIEGKNILLVDDVFTSGSTSSVCAQVLKAGGAKTVDVFTLARAVMN
ncbi:MAG: ComF family protein [Pyrinomonadaceae bacterium]